MLASSERSMRGRCCAVAVACLALGVFVSAAHAQWPGWGGPNRDFVVRGEKLATSWPEGGPKEAWKRPLGEGYSAIVVDGGKLYTMYRTGENEVIVALDAKTGATEWEHSYEAKVPEGIETRFGKGPNSTPQIAGDKIAAFGFTGMLTVLDKKSGKVVWQHDLVKEHGMSTPHFGVSGSPIAIGNDLIVPAGGEGKGLMSFALKSGKLNWSKHDFVNLYSSPQVFKLAGKEQIVLLAHDKIVGLDPEGGDLLWSAKHENQWKTNISTPLMTEDGALFVSAGGEAGGKLLRIVKSGDGFKAEEVWSNRKVSMSQSNGVRVGGHIYGVAGGEPSFFVAINSEDGKVLWRERGYSKAMTLAVDDQLLILNEDGTLALAKATPEKFEIVAKAPVLKEEAWTIPTLVDGTLYLRDKKNIMALNVGK